MDSKKLHFYHTGYYSHEDSRYTTLCHELHFTQEEFEALCVEAAVELIRAFVQGPLTHPHPANDQPTADLPLTSFDALSNRIPEHLIQHRGFTPLQFSGEFYLSGWDPILPENLDREGFHYSKQNKAITLRIISEGLAEVLEERNRRIHEFNEAVWAAIDEEEKEKEGRLLVAQGLVEEPSPAPERNLREELEEDNGRDE